MKNNNMIIFFSVIFCIHFIVNLYIYTRASQGLEGTPNMLLALRFIMIFLFLAYPAGRFLEAIWYTPISKFIHWAGALWFAGMLYIVLTLVTLDIVRWLNMAFQFLPDFITQDYLKVKLLLTYSITIGIVVMVIFGHINAWNPKIVHKTIHINKQVSNMKELKIVAASDIHLGTIIGPRKTGMLVKSINKLKPDIILFAGDVIDEDIKPVIEQNLGNNLLDLKAPLGVYAITGNHEYIGGADKAVDYLREHGITVLRDSSVLINDSFFLVGREDKDKPRITNEVRKTVDDLVKVVDKSKPIILLDHQPTNLQAASSANIDLQISGHTHHGQLWPLSYITRAVFEVSKGYKKIKNSHFYVSTGFGTWGPPVRIGNRPEILDITLKFD